VLESCVLAVMPRIDYQHRGPVTADALIPILDTLGALSLDEDVLARAQAGELPSPVPTPTPPPGSDQLSAPKRVCVHSAAQV
jgi:hypothetical protein